MKAILKFNLPDEQTEFKFATQGADWWMVAWDMDQWLRSQIKHPPDDMPPEEYEAYEKCREQLRELINERGLILNQ